MAGDNPRIDELRRRVEADPASIAFAQLGEEYRRAGNIVEAIRVCRAGLARHPGYLSARVTLGRALIEHNELDAARTELETVLQSAPENLAAVRGLAEIHYRRGDGHAALAQFRVALQLARHDHELEQIISDLERELNAKAKPAAPVLSLEELQAEFLDGLEVGPPGAVSEAMTSTPVPPEAIIPPAVDLDTVASAPLAIAVDLTPPTIVDPPPDSPVNVEFTAVPPANVEPPRVAAMSDGTAAQLARLQRFLDAILAYRSARA